MSVAVGTKAPAFTLPSKPGNPVDLSQTLGHQKTVILFFPLAFSPVLMTALVTAFALAPLLFEAERPGTEILHPVAVVIFSGLISSTLLDTFLTPAMFWLFGRKPAEALLQDKDAEAF